MAPAVKSMLYFIAQVRNEGSQIISKDYIYLLFRIPIRFPVPARILRDNSERQFHRTTIQTHHPHRKTHHVSDRNPLQRMRLPDVRSPSSLLRELFKRKHEVADTGSDARRHPKRTAGEIIEGIPDQSGAHVGAVPAQLLFGFGESRQDARHPRSDVEDQEGQFRKVHGRFAELQEGRL